MTDYEVGSLGEVGLFHEPPPAVIDTARYLIVSTIRPYLTRCLLGESPALVDSWDRPVTLDPKDWLLERVDIEPVTGDCHILFRPVANPNPATVHRLAQGVILRFGERWGDA